MIDSSKYADKIQYYESIRALFVRVGQMFGINYEGMTIEEALNEAVFDKFTEDEISAQDIDTVCLLYLGDLLQSLSAVLPEADAEVKARLSGLQLELNRIEAMVKDIKPTTTIINESAPIDLSPLEEMKSRVLALQDSAHGLKSLEIRQLSVSIEINEIKTELDSINEILADLAREFKTWRHKDPMLIKGSGGVGFGGGTSKSWVELCVSASEDPVQIATIASGEVWRFVYPDKTLYRLYPTPYVRSVDAFYTGFNAGVLSGLVLRRTS